jgi:cell division protein FtsL
MLASDLSGTLISSAGRIGRAFPLRANLARFGRWSLFVPALAIVGLLSLLYVNQTSDLAATAYDVADLQREKLRWEMRNEQLRLEIARLQSLNRVDREATARLGMGPPRREIYVAIAPAIPPTPPTSESPDAQGWTSAVGRAIRLLLSWARGQPTTP